MNLYFQVTGLLLILIPLGARLFHVLYEEPGYYSEQPLRVLEFWQGGFVYYGGLLLSLFGIILFFGVKKRERTFWQTADFLTPYLILGTGLGRVACFVQGCCFGGPWPLAFPPFERHPTQLYLLFWEAFLFYLLTARFKKSWRQPGDLFLSWILLSAFGRLIVEHWRVDFRGQMLLGFSISQIIALALMLIVVPFYLTRRKA